MSREHVEKVVFDFIDSKNPEVLAVTGSWGVGKTYALRKIIAAYKGKQSLSHYSYVSVFGAQSIAAIRTAILTNTRSLPFEDNAGETRREKWSRRLPIRDLTNQLRELKFFGVSNIVLAAETFAGAFLKDTLVCLDDIERHSKTVSMQDVMGLVSELKEQSNCKVILVLNEDNLGGSKEEFDRYSEKVIDQKLQFSLTSAEAAKLGCSADTPLRDLALDYIERLEISNIRVIKKIERNLKMLAPGLEGRSVALNKNLVVSVCVFAAVLYEQSRGFPSSKDILKYNSFSRALERVNQDRRQAEPDPHWVTLLDRCEFTNVDEFDEAILKAMESGYLPGSGFEEQATAYDMVARRTELEAKFSAAWRLFHDRLDVSAEDLVKAWSEAIDEAAVVINPVNLNSTVRLMRELGFDGEADAAIETYIEQRKATPKIFDIDHQSRLGDVDDPRFRERCFEELHRSRRDFTLKMAADMIIENKEWDDAIPSTLAAASPDEMIALLKDYQGPRLNGLVEGILRAHGTPEEMEAVRSTMITAAEVIANESPLNRIRVRRWGFDLPSDADRQA
ncbi:P-loop NTPase fold protein [Burkholderia sp. A2]|uniref:P-loop NTPase fold protein n=1 Tax=Burkholderia sp. A2 TaxID=236253 RepID=UPI000A48C10A|nr:P-loop NTPase fold protein [Burkholderia sp. A2]